MLTTHLMYNTKGNIFCKTAFQEPTTEMLKLRKYYLEKEGKGHRCWEWNWTPYVNMHIYQSRFNSFGVVKDNEIQNV